jgi:L-arabinose isomerase
MINCMKEFEFWFVTGSQNLYGEEVIEKVRNHAMEMVRVMDDQISGKLIFKDVMITPEKITNLIKEANYDDKCTGIITWMHTFSPSKMWINGLKILNTSFYMALFICSGNVAEPEGKTVVGG